MQAKAIVTGRFAAEKQAVLAVDKLLYACIRGDRVHTLFLKPLKRRVSRFGGTHKRSSRSERPEGALKDTATARAIDLEVVPAVAADGLAVSAFTESLAGALGKAGEEGSRTPVQPDGIMIAVETSDYVSQFLAVSVLREYGAHDIERADGLWQDRKWPDLDPVPLSSLLDRSVDDEENSKAALLRPKLNPRHH